MVNLIKYVAVTCCCVVGTLDAQVARGLAESDYYKIESVPIPENVILEVGGLAFDDKGRLGVSTRRGEVWLITNPSSAQPDFQRYAHGLHEPLGLAFTNGRFYTAQRGELTRLNDRDGDDVADEYYNIRDWDLNGNYHEYSYGPVLLPDGDMLITLNLGWVGRGASESKWRGWMMKLTPEGEMTPIATGMRSPAGFGLNAKGDIFYTENQGDWVGSGRMTHIEKGDFAGHPEGLKWSGEPGSPLNLRMEDIDDSDGLSLYQYQEKFDAVKPPSVWFPHTLMGISTSDIAVIPDGFGPFNDQLLVGDQGHSKVMRVYQEKVNGVYQGICYPFVEGFASGILRLEWSDDKTLYVGMTNRGWASTGKDKFGLQKLTWTGVVPFEVLQVNAESDGFRVSFTKEVDRRTAANPESYLINDFTYQYHHLYGSPVVDQQERTVYKVEVAQDNRSARLFVEGMRPGYIYEINADGVRSAVSEQLVHPTGYFTLNAIPGDHVHHQHDMSATSVFSAPDIISAKRVTEMPGSWLDGPDETITVGTIPGMKFDQTEIRVRAGSKVKLIFNNPDDMMHNLVIIKPEKEASVADAANRMGLQGQEKGYIPDSEHIVAHTNLLEPNESDIIYLTIPEEPGTYSILCTFPGHAASMRADLIVADTPSN
ncbi:MAG: auracyanin family protein [Saprospiraceae bacterium]|nr:auracyanin family protein [Saprospiraceae bacterium]